jgi:hypothetical protein
MISRDQDRACEARPLKQSQLNENSIEIWRLNQLIHLMQWLYDECHHPEANSNNIILKFFEKSNKLRGKS